VTDSNLPHEVERPGGLLSKVSGALIMYHDPRSLHAEQYRSARTNLTALNRRGGPWSLVITSSKKGEGKSVTAANLAACLAELPGTKVCLIDTDFRAPTQAGVFGIDNQPGLSDLIEDRAAYKDVMHETVVPNLHVMCAGEEPRSPAEVLGSERFGNLIGELKRRYTWILLDTPPVNPYTDACVLTAQCNGSLLVVRMDETNKELVQRSMQNLVRAGGKVLGTFLAGMPTDREDSDRAGYYRLDAGDRELAKQEVARARARRKAERRLRTQEKAFLARQKAREREQRREDEPEV
jgi:capsular exopolysaccharide synthesis family protein